MPIPILKLSAEYDRLYHPFTGQALDGDRPEQPAGVLFIYYGDAGHYAYLSPALLERLAEIGIECDAHTCDINPQELAGKLDWPGAFILEIDASWNGINWYGLEVQ
jgi:hypothetical protein